MKDRRDLFVAFIHLGGGIAFFLLILLTDFEPLRYFSGLGLPIVFLAAFLESVYLVGLYFPGSVIMVAALLATPTLWHMVPVMATIWLGTLAGLLLDCVLARRIPELPQSADLDVPPELFGRWGPVLSAVHPNVSATYVFDRAAKRRLSARDFAKLASAAFVFLFIYSTILASLGSSARSEQRTVALVWTLFVILIGVGGIVSVVRRRYAKNQGRDAA